MDYTNKYTHTKKYQQQQAASKNKHHKIFSNLLDIYGINTTKKPRKYL